MNINVKKIVIYSSSILFSFMARKFAAPQVKIVTGPTGSLLSSRSPSRIFVAADEQDEEGDQDDTDVPLPDVVQHVLCMQVRDSAGRLVACYTMDVDGEAGQMPKKISRPTTHLANYGSRQVQLGAKNRAMRAMTVATRITSA